MKITKRQLRRLIEQSIIPDPDTRWSDKDIDEYVQQLEDFFGLNKSTDAKLIHDIRLALKKRLQRNRSGFLGLWDNFEQMALYPAASRGLKQSKALQSLTALLGLELANQLGRKLRGALLRTSNKIAPIKEGTNLMITRRQLRMIIREQFDPNDPRFDPNLGESPPGAGFGLPDEPFLIPLRSDDERKEAIAKEIWNHIVYDRPLGKDSQKVWDKIPRKIQDALKGLGDNLEWFPENVKQNLIEMIASAIDAAADLIDI